MGIHVIHSQAEAESKTMWNVVPRLKTQCVRLYSCMMLYDAARTAWCCIPRCAHSGPLLRDACGLDSVSEDQGQDAFPVAHDMGTPVKVPCWELLSVLKGFWFVQILASQLNQCSAYLSISLHPFAGCRHFRCHSRFAKAWPDSGEYPWDPSARADKPHCQGTRGDNGWVGFSTSEKAEGCQRPSESFLSGFPLRWTTTRRKQCTWRRWHRCCWKSLLAESQILKLNWSSWKVPLVCSSPAKACVWDPTTPMPLIT